MRSTTGARDPEGVCRPRRRRLALAEQHEPFLTTLDPAKAPPFPPDLVPEPVVESRILSGQPGLLRDETTSQGVLRGSRSA